jgi:DNA polymerase III alpha subunit (gram-positive type)
VDKNVFPLGEKMIYCSLDIETTGLDPANCDIIQFAAVVDDLANPQPIEQLPTFQTYFLKSFYKGEAAALAMHPEIFKKIADVQRKQGKVEFNEAGERFMQITDLPIAFKNFLIKSGIPEEPSNYFSFHNKVQVTVAGKNAAVFDLPFLKTHIKDWHGVYFNHRVIDPAILYYQPGDSQLPGSKVCMERAGLAGEVAHTALEDALMVVKLVRNKLLNQTEKVPNHQ